MAFQALIVSGDGPLVQRFSAALNEVGIQIEPVSETGRAFSMLCSRHFDAVILDCDLEDALDLLAIIRDEKTTQKSLVIAFVSGNPAAKAASGLGANFILSKPVNWDIAKRTLKAAHTLIIRERRKSIREKVRVPAKLFFDDRTADATILDLSDGGLAVRAAVPLTIRTPVDVELTLPGYGSVIQCKGIVAWATGGLAGIEFCSLTPASARVIVGWLDRHSPRRGQLNRQISPANHALSWGF